MFHYYAFGAGCLAVCGINYLLYKCWRILQSLARHGETALADNARMIEQNERMNLQFSKYIEQTDKFSTQHRAAVLSDRELTNDRHKELLERVDGLISNGEDSLEHAKMSHKTMNEWADRLIDRSELFVSHSVRQLKERLSDAEGMIVEQRKRIGAAIEPEYKSANERAEHSVWSADPETVVRESQLKRKERK